MNAPGSPVEIAPLSRETFNQFRRLIYEKTGINMREGKQILVSNRLRRRLLSLQLATYEQYFHLLTRGDQAGEELPHFISAVSTNETYFFRERNHFRLLVDTVLPEIRSRRRVVRIWSAGCSTGEEPYSLRIATDEATGRGMPRVEIVGTDISPQVISAARAGVYRGRSLQHVSPDVLLRYFEAGHDDSWRVRDRARQNLEFRVHNLLLDPPPAGTFDVIFCRNVMIYFDKPTQKRLVDGILAGALHPQGYLFIGHAESLSGFSECFAYEARFRSPVYRRKEIPQ